VKQVATTVVRTSDHTETSGILPFRADVDNNVERGASAPQALMILLYRLQLARNILCDDQQLAGNIKVNFKNRGE
jgi:hypothetical protein